MIRAFARLKKCRDIISCLPRITWKLCTEVPGTRSEQPRMFKAEIHLGWRFVLGTKSQFHLDGQMSCSGVLRNFRRSCFLFYWRKNVCIEAFKLYCSVSPICEEFVLWNFFLRLKWPLMRWKICYLLWKPRVCPFSVVSCIWTHLSGCEMTVKHIVQLCCCFLFVL